jgi:ATP-dependent DNA helicase RecQ
LRAIWRRLVEAQVTAGERALTPAELDDVVRSDGLPVALAALRASGLIDPDALRLRSLDVDTALDHAPIEERHRYALSRLGQMIEYAETPGCRRALILRYFGEHPGERCTNCDNCVATAAPRADSYPEDLFAALLALRSELARDSNRPPYLVFEERTAREIATYRPSTEAALLETWGVGERRMQWFGQRVLALVLEWERQHPDAAPPPARPPAAAQLAARAADGPEVSFDDPTFQRLRSWRRERARADGVPPYTLFSDRTARELASVRPADEDGLRGVWGLGDARVRAFGPDLLAVLAGTD